MKQGYVYKNGKVIVYDDKIEPTEREYQDNIGKLLERENLKEYLENQLEDLKVADEELEILVENYTITRTIIRYIGKIIITLLALPIFSSLIFQKSLSELISLLGGIKNYLLIFTPIISFGLSAPCTKKCSDIKYYQKEKKSVESQIEYINVYLKKLEKEIEKLKNKKEKENEPIKETKKSIDLDNIKTTKAILSLIEEAGFEEKKYLEYLKKGILRKKLLENYEENEIKVIEYYIESKSKILEKKHKD